MAARYAIQSFHFHNSTSGRDEFVNIGALRDSATVAVTSYPAMFSSTPLVVGQTGLDPKTGEFLKIHGGGPGE